MSPRADADIQYHLVDSPSGCRVAQQHSARDFCGIADSGIIAVPHWSLSDRAVDGPPPVSISRECGGGRRGIAPPGGRGGALGAARAAALAIALLWCLIDLAHLVNALTKAIAGTAAIAWISPPPRPFVMLLAVFNITAAMAIAAIVMRLNRHLMQGLLSSQRFRWLLAASILIAVFAYFPRGIWTGLIYDALGRPTRRSGWDATMVLTMAVYLIPVFAWRIWLLVELHAARRRLTRFARNHRCLKCGYQLQNRAHQGCPECGWGRADDS